MKSAAKVVGHWLHRTLALAYETWHEHANAQARMRGMLKRIAEPVSYTHLTLPTTVIV